MEVKEGDIVVLDLVKNGDLVEVVEFHHEYEIGRIAQRYGDALIFINESSASCYQLLFKITKTESHYSKIKFKIIKLAKTVNKRNYEV